MYTVEDVTDRYGVIEHTVLKWIHSGELKAINVGRTPAARKPLWRITEQALAEFEAKRTPAPPPPRAKRRKSPAGIIEFYK
jgi:excisionase family DNA binding protein